MRQPTRTTAVTPARARALLAVAAATVAALGLSACSSSSDIAAPTGSASETSASSTPSTSPSTSTSGSPSSSPTKAGKPTPPAVERPDALPEAQKASAKPVPYKSPAEYSDGLTLEITSIRQWTITETGAGALTGKPATSFRMKLVNGTGKKVDLNNVVVGAVYGSGNETAMPVYSDPELFDFNGTLAPGKSAKAVYAFSIPVKDLTTTTLFVDIDGRHTVATFSGSAKS